MSKKHKHPIEQKITEVLQQEIRSTTPIPSEQLLQAVRKHKQSSFERVAQYQMPLWQTAAAVLLFMLGGHFLFPKIITQEKHFVQTEIQATFICQTDTLIQIQEIERIVRIPVPSSPKTLTQPIIKNSINPMIDAIDNTTVMLNANANTSTPTLATTQSSLTNTTTTSPSSSLGRNIQEDADLMEFVIESEQFSVMPVQLKNK